MIKLIKNELKFRRISVLKFGIAAAIINIIAIALILILHVDVNELILLALNNDHAAVEKLIQSYGIVMGIVLPIVAVFNGLLLFFPLLNAILSFRRDTFSKERYLVYSLPVKNSEIIGSRLAVACIDFGLALLLFMVFITIMLLSLLRGAVFGPLLHFVVANLPMLILFFVARVFEFGLCILTIYTVVMIISMAVRIANKGKKIIGLVFGILLFNILINIGGFIIDWIYKNAKMFQIKADTASLQSSIIDFYRNYLSLPELSQQHLQFNFTMNLAVVSAEIVMFAILFMGITWLINKKFEV